MRIHFIWRSVQRAQPKSPQATAPPSLIGRSARCGVDSIQRLQRAEPRFTFLLWKSSGAFRFTVSGFHGGGGAAARIGSDRGGLPPDSSLLSSILMPGALEPSRGLPKGMTPIRVNLVPGVAAHWS